MTRAISVICTEEIIVPYFFCQNDKLSVFNSLATRQSSCITSRYKQIQSGDEDASDTLGSLCTGNASFAKWLLWTLLVSHSSVSFRVEKNLDDAATNKC